MSSRADSSGRVRRGGETATTLIELLLSMALFSVLMVVLALVLDASLDRFRRGTETVGLRGGIAAAEEWLRRDLAHRLGQRPMDLPRLPPAASAQQREQFENRLLFPFEINRQSGLDGAASGSFANAAPGFDSIAFVVGPTGGETGAGGAPAAIVGYYVAYAHHSPLAENPGAGMKLFRHFRRVGHPEGAGYADGTLRFLVAEINDAWAEDDGTPDRRLTEPNPAAVRQGRFGNRDFPFLLSMRIAREGRREAVVPPWPKHPVRAGLVAPPPTYRPDRGSAGDWEDPSSPVHDSVFPDEPVCDHVVRFELRPFLRRIRDDGAAEWMDAAALNAHLGLSASGEWPALVVPDLVEVVIATVPETVARLLERYEDWVSPGPGSIAARRIREEARTQVFRIMLPRECP